MVIYSPNRLEMLQLELALMASGYVAVPVFAYFNQDTAELLIKHSRAQYLAVAGEFQIANITPDLALKQIFVFDESVSDNRFPKLRQFSDLLKKRPDPTRQPDQKVAPDTVCLNMYTSGTMGTPKCVQLSHKNILSQQAAMQVLWDLDENDRFLSSLPWHHSFGGIYELFTALYNGATFHLESSFGKNPQTILENWKLVKPTVFFSVPKIYQALFDLISEDEEIENIFFHPGLKFIFTAAAPLPGALTHEFEKRNIPVYEGWGLTETSPCCTVTDAKIKRLPGVVGKPIPGVKLRLAADGEIQVNGPNVMKGYFDNDTANAGAFTNDGWFRTGDIGQFTESGLRLIARKDRIFKLSNGEKVIPTEMEAKIQNRCPFISFALVEGSGESYPVALLFPNNALFNSSENGEMPFTRCAGPQDIEELQGCLKKCLDELNTEIKQKFAKIRAAALIDEELSIENRTLTPSMKVIPKRVGNIYQDQIYALYDEEKKAGENVYVIRLT